MSAVNASLKIALLAARSSIHTTRWANSMSQRGHEVHLIASEKVGPTLDSRVIFHHLQFPAPFGYFINTWNLKKLLATIQPDILHSHYISGYGTLANLSGFQPRISSVWGTDIYEFPNKSPIHKSLVKANLKNSRWVASTSKAMAAQTLKVCPEISQKISVTPFGIELDKFSTSSEKQRIFTVGTVKSLEKRYGIDILLKGFNLFKKSMPNFATQLLIVGDGSKKAELQEMAKKLNLDNSVVFTGAKKHEEVPQYLSKMDVYCALSRAESFGVAVLEASASGRPVVVSRVGGLPEVVEQGETGYIIDEESPQQLADKLMELAKNPDLLRKMGQRGRQWVETQYNWQDNVEQMENLYHKVIAAEAHRD